MSTQPETPSGGNRAVKAVVAILFVAALGAALAVPIILSSDSAPTADRKRPRAKRTKVAVAPSPSPSPTPTPPAPRPSPSPSPSETVAANRFATPYPDHCLDAIAPPSGTGFVAAYDGRRVSMEPVAGGETTSVRVDPPIAWSPTGDVLATGGGALFTSAGERDGNLFGHGSGQWAWSPIANCAIQAGPDGIYASSIHGPDKLLTSISAVDFTISPDGTRVAFLHDHDDGSISLLFANLRRGTIREALPPAEGVTVTLHGWAPDGITALYSVAETDSRNDDAAPLLGVAQGEGPEAFSAELTVSRAADAVSTCGSQLIAAVGREGSRGTRLAFLEAGEEPDFLTATGFTYGSPACSTDGAFAVAVRAPNGARRGERLVLLQLDDGSESVLTSGDYTDEHAEWADTATAVLLVRRALGGGRAQVWVLQGSSAQPTGLTLDPAVTYYGSSTWTVGLDWSATAPSGAPSG
jgi:Tol biopolymer transport system component